ncbi:hypothetical protein D3C85_1007280 [compost metagenome]
MLALGREQLHQAGERTTNTHCLQLSIRQLVGADRHYTLDQRYRGIDHGVVTQGFQQTPQRLRRTGHLLQHRHTVAQVLEIGDRKLVQRPPPAVDIVGAVQCANAFSEHLAVFFGVIQLPPLAEHPLVDHRQFGDVPGARFEVLLEALGGE